MECLGQLEPPFWDLSKGKPVEQLFLAIVLEYVFLEGTASGYRVA